MAGLDREQIPIAARGAVVVLLLMVVIGGVVMLSRNGNDAPADPSPGQTTPFAIKGPGLDAVPKTEPEEVSPTPSPGSTFAVVTGRVVNDLLQPVADCEVLLVPLDPVFQLVAPRPAPSAEQQAGQAGQAGQPDTEITATTLADGRFEIRVPADRPHVLALRARDIPLQIVLDGLVLPPYALRPLGDLPLHGRPGLTVHVADGDGRPIPGARVELMPISGAHGGIAALMQRPESRRITLTDDTGQSLLAGVLPTRHRLRIDAAGFASHEQPYEHLANTWPKLQVNLDAGMTLRGRVLDLDQPVALQVSVEAELVPEGRAERVDVASDGSFRITGLRPGVLKFWLAAPAFGRHLAAQMDVQSDAAPLELRFPSMPVLSGRVFSTSGQPLRGAEVRQLVPFEAGVEGARTSTRSDGTFTLAVPAGETHLEVRDGQRPAATFGPFLAPQSDLQLTVGPGAQLEGQLVDPDGRPLAGAVVELLPADHDGGTLAELLLQATGGPVAKTLTGPDGRYQLEGLPEGRYRLRLTATGLVIGSTIPFALKQGQQTLQLGSHRLQTGTVVTGTVRDQTGTPCRWMQVRIEAASDQDFRPALHATTDALGRFTTPPLAPGRHRFFLVPAPDPDLARRSDVVGKSLKEIMVPAKGPFSVELALDP